MFKIEKQFLEWVDRNLIIIVGIVGTVFSVLIRYCFKDIESGDYNYFLKSWYNQISVRGINSLSEQVGDYNFLYQICIAIMTYFPIKPLYAYKILSIFFDYCLAAITAVIVGMISERNKKSNAIIAYFAVLFSPIVILNSSAWAQCDSIYVFFAVIALYMLIKEKYLVSFVFLGISFAFKLQAVFILPFFMFVYFVKKKFSILNFIVIPLTMIITGLPAIFLGRSIIEMFIVYFVQTSYKKIAMNYPSFWTILFDIESDVYYNEKRFAAILLTIVILAALMIWWIKSRIKLSSKNMVYMAFIISYTCVLFLPQMHERYGYLYEILAIIILFLNSKTIRLIIPLYMLTFITYGNFLFGLSHNIDLYMGIVNILVWLGYINIIIAEFSCEKCNCC